MKRAQILLAATADAVIATTVHVGTSTIYRTKQDFVERGLERALSEGTAARRETETDRGKRRS